MKISSYLIYDKLTGLISRQVTCSDALIEYQPSPSEAYIEGAGDDSALYVDVETRQLRPKRDFALSALPLPCVIRIEGVEYRCTTQPQFEFDVPGTYQIEVDAGPQFNKKVFAYAYPALSR